jgi:hypothetical protein
MFSDGLFTPFLFEVIDEFLVVNTGKIVDFHKFT